SPYCEGHILPTWRAEGKVLQPFFASHSSCANRLRQNNDREHENFELREGGGRGCCALGAPLRSRQRSDRATHRQLGGSADRACRSPTSYTCYASAHFLLTFFQIQMATTHRSLPGGSRYWHHLLSQ